MRVYRKCMLSTCWGDEKQDSEKNDMLDNIIESIEKVAVEIAGTDDKVK